MKTLNRQVIYFDHKQAKEDVDRTSKAGFDSYMQFDPNQDRPAWRVTFKTFAAKSPIRK